jgi:hypothetical protein
MNKAILIIVNDWEGLYVDGDLIAEGHTINEGEERSIYFAKLAHIYNFDLIKMEIRYCEDCDNELTDELGYLPPTIDGFIKIYK